MANTQFTILLCITYMYIQTINSNILRLSDSDFFPFFSSDTIGLSKIYRSSFGRRGNDDGHSGKEMKMHYNLPGHNFDFVLRSINCLQVPAPYSVLNSRRTSIFTSYKTYYSDHFNFNFIACTLYNSIFYIYEIAINILYCFLMIDDS